MRAVLCWLSFVAVGCIHTADSATNEEDPTTRDPSAAPRVADNESAPDVEDETPPAVGTFKLRAAKEIRLLEGASVDLEITIVRGEGFTDAVSITTDLLPPEVEAKPLTIAASDSKATLSLSTAYGSAFTMGTATLRATASRLQATRSLGYRFRGIAGSVDRSSGIMQLVPSDATSLDTRSAPLSNGGSIFISGSELGRFDGTKRDETFSTRVDWGFPLVLADDTLYFGTGRLLTNDGKSIKVSRYLADGRVDATFGGGTVTVPIPFDASYLTGLHAQADGKLLVGGFRLVGITHEGAIARLDANGAPDVTFGDGGYYLGKIAPEGDPQHFVVTASGAIRSFGFLHKLGLTADGDLDAGYDTRRLFSFTSSAALQSDERVVVAGMNDSGNPRRGLARYGVDGKADASFGSGGLLAVADLPGRPDNVYSVAVAAGGAILAATFAYQSKDVTLIKLDADGRPDLTFGSGGFVKLPLTEKPESVTIEPDGERVRVASSRSLVRMWL